MLFIWFIGSNNIVLDTLCNKVCQWLATGRWFSPGIPVFSTNKSDRLDVTEILLIVASNTIDQPTNQPTNQSTYLSLFI